MEYTGWRFMLWGVYIWQSLLSACLYACMGMVSGRLSLLLVFCVGLSISVVINIMEANVSLGTSEDIVQSVLESPLYPSYPTHALNRTCTKWAVSTTIFGPSPAMVQLLGKFQDGGTPMCLVVIGDKKTNNSEWFEFVTQYPEQLVFFSFDDQAYMNFAINTLIPANHFSRKNIGYLFAIQAGAEMIYDFDDDNILKNDHVIFDNVLNGMLDDTAFVSFNSSHHLFNPYPFFEPVDKSGGNQFLWPRGFPLEFIHDPDTFELSPSPVDPRVSRVAVYQSLADIDPDVDAIFRMTRELPVFFSKTDAIVVSPMASFAPWNAQATIFTPSAFYGLILPISVSGRVSDIWRSYITSRLMWASGFHVAFTSSFVNQFRNPHNYHIDFQDEIDLFMSSDSVIRALMFNEKCSSLPELYLKLISVLVEKGYIQEIDLRLATLWVQDLNAVGYQWPEIVTPRRVEFRQPRETLVIDHRVHSLQHLSKSTENSGAQPPIIKDTAICISGQLRSLNMNDQSSEFPQQLEPMMTSYTSQNLQGRSVAETIVQNVYPFVGQFDVFMTVATLEGPREPKVGDLTACASLTPLSPARMFCEITLQMDVVGLENDEIWKTFGYAGSARLQQGLLQQLSGLRQCSMMISRQMLKENVQYRYIMRIRPDMAVMGPMPSISSMLDKNEQDIIKIVHKENCCCGNVDWFGVGHFTAMQIYLQRISALNSLSREFLRAGSWDAESFLVQYLKKNYNITLVQEKDLMGCIVKPKTRQSPSDP